MVHLLYLVCSVGTVWYGTDDRAAGRLPTLQSHFSVNHFHHISGSDYIIDPLVASSDDSTNISASLRRPHPKSFPDDGECDACDTADSARHFLVAVGVRRLFFQTFGCG